MRLRSISIFCFSTLFAAFHSQAAELDLDQELGRSSVSVLLEEEEDDDRFSFWRSRLGVTQGDETAKLRFKAERRERDYKTRQSDFSANRLEAEAWRKTSWRGVPFRGGVFGLWRNKEFDLLSLSGYREFRAGAYADGYQGFDLRASASHYDYVGGRKEDKLRTHLAREWEGDLWTIRPSALGEWHAATGRLKIKKEAGVTASFKPDLKYWQRISAEFTSGQRDTKDNEEREDDVDYSFWEAELRGHHEISRLHLARWRAGFQEKDDKDGHFSNRSRLFQGWWKWAPDHGRAGQVKFHAEPFAGWKRAAFIELPALTYEKTTAGASAAVAVWSDWRLEGEAKLELYHFTNQNRHSQKSASRVSFKRDLSDKAEVELGAGFRGSLVFFKAGISLKI